MIHELKTVQQFTDEEIMQHMLAYADRECDSCEVSPTCCNRCVIAIIKAGVDLINRQKAEIEEKSKRLREVLPIVAELKAEAIKEFAERLKNYEGVVTDLGNGVVLRAVNSKHIDGLLKEMLGGNVCETNTETEKSQETE